MVTIINDLNRMLNRCLQTISGSRTSTLLQVLFDSYDTCDFEIHVLISSFLTIFHQILLTIDN